MSGLTGFVDRKGLIPQPLNILKNMMDTLKPRGPNYAQAMLVGSAGLAYRHLQVNGEQAAQPYVLTRSGREGPIACMVSGCIDNVPELALLLTEKGHTCTTNDPAELLALAYITWGRSFVQRIGGSFAFVLWLEKSATLILGRDRLGAEPLYYHQVGTTVLFGSVPRALFAVPWFRPVFSSQGLADIFSVATKPPGVTVYENIHEVKPGTTLTFQENAVQEWRYWQLEAHQHQDDTPHTVAMVKELLCAAVSRRMSWGDFPASILLSGGLDSSVITAFAGQLARTNRQGSLKTYSFEFENAQADFVADALHLSLDSPYVDAVARHVKSQHTSVVLSQQSYVDELLTTLKARDLPGVGDLDISLYQLYREVRKYSRIALSGEGADDLFGGYPWFLAEATKPSNSFPWSAGIADRSSILAPELQTSHNIDAMVANRYEQAIAEVPTLKGESGTDRRMREVFYLELTRFLPFLLDRMDRMAGAVGLQSRAPFIDHRLVEYCWNIPFQLKRLGDTEKGIVREAVSGMLPEEVRLRKKSGFAVVQSPQYLSGIRSGILDLLSDASSPVASFLNKHMLSEMVTGDRWADGKFSAPPILPRALLFDHWVREYRIDVQL